MAGLLNTVIYVGPAVLLLGLLTALACFAAQLSGSGVSQVLRRVVFAAGIGLGGFVVGTGLGIAVFCSTASTGNLCGLGGVFGTGPFLAGVCLGGYAIRTLRAQRPAS